MPESANNEAGDLSSELFRAHADQVVEWIAKYRDGVGMMPVLSGVKPGDVRRSLPEGPPTDGESFDAILSDFREKILPGITHWNHPGFLAYFGITASAPGILGEMLTAALNVNGMLWITSPAATELEAVTLDWLRQMMGVEGKWFGIINDTASVSTLVALAAAREAHSDLEIRAKGMAGRGELPVMRIYASVHAHSSVDKAAMTLGIGSDNVVHIECDEDFRMRADALRMAIIADRARGFLPVAAVATVGTTSTTSIDPVGAIADVCEEQRVWLHVDAAYGGVAGIVPEMRSVTADVQRADSFVVNPHKWLFTPIDCSVLYTRRPDVLKRAFSLVPEYLITGASDDDAVNTMDYGIQLGRRFRSLKLWMVIRAFGVHGLAGRIRRHCELARELADWVRGEEDWRVEAPVPFSVVCLRYVPPGTTDDEADLANERIMRAVNASGKVYLSHTRLRGRYVIRVAIGNLRTERRHLEDAWQLLRDAAAANQAVR